MQYWWLAVTSIFRDIKDRKKMNKWLLGSKISQFYFQFRSKHNKASQMTIFETDLMSYYFLLILNKVPDFADD